jgi:hypothetical protein
MLRDFNHRVHKGEKRVHKRKSFAYKRTFEVSKTSKVFLWILRKRCKGRGGILPWRAKGK